MVNFRMPSLERQASLQSKGSFVSYTKTQSVSGKTVASDVSHGTADTTTKPTNVFYIWYSELCRRQNTNPVSVIRPTHLKNDQVLDFVADRIKVEDWHPIFNALRLDTSLHVIGIHSRMESQKLNEEADTEEKVRRMKKWFGLICTKYVLKALIKSVCMCLKRTPVLTCLELEGLQLNGEHLIAILKGMTQNKSLKYISFKSCPIGEDGCFEICETLHLLPNIEILNLTGCNLGPKSCEYLAKLIKYQQINRYCESWHSSLRYEDPVVNNMAGLKRMTLNNNPKIGDEGLEFILNELVDDLWIKALDMQKCNITEGIASKIIDVIDYSRSIEIADFRHNNLESCTIARILEILKKKQDEDGEYQWCLTSSSLTNSLLETYTSVPNNRAVTAKSSKKVTFKRQATAPILLEKTNCRKASDLKENKEKINNIVKPDNSCLLKAKDQLMQLYEKLKEETLRRQQAEEKCAQLQKQVDELLSLQKNQMILKEFTNMKQYINKFINFIQQHGNAEEHTPIIQDLQNALQEVQTLAKPYEKHSKTSKNNPVKTSASNESFTQDESNENSDVKMQSLFQNMLGSQADINSDVENLDNFGMDLNANLSGCSKTTVHSDSYTDVIDTARSTDSESVETYQKLLDELSREEKSSALEVMSDVNIVSREEKTKKDPFKLVVKIPDVVL